MEHPTYSPDLAPNDFCFQKYSLPYRDEYFRILKTSKKCDDSTESCSTTAVPKMSPIVLSSFG
jgi:hypothetical protein